MSVSKQSMRGVGLTGSPVYGSGQLDYDTRRGHDDEGTVARFFFQADWSYEQIEQEELWNGKGNQAAA